MFLMTETVLKHHVCAIVIIMLCLVPLKARAFQCYVCDSKSDIECIENLPKDSKLQPQECNNIVGAKYCIKTTNIYAGELGTKRFCAANDHGNYCRYVKQPTGDREYRSCVLTCNSQNCNSAPGGSMTPTHYQYVLSSLMTFLCLILISSPFQWHEFYK